MHHSHWLVAVAIVTEECTVAIVCIGVGVCGAPREGQLESLAHARLVPLRMALVSLDEVQKGGELVYVSVLHWPQLWLRWVVYDPLFLPCQCYVTGIGEAGLSPPPPLITPSIPLHHSNSKM